jgi:hypothetical protein
MRIGYFSLSTKSWELHYLASREASWVTGQVYPLNGGALTA